MFGEFNEEDQSQPLGSPWDSLMCTGIPKLVPEVEEGNVEYKLQLLSPTPARFARLVTQLQWRILEGGGQAYYELGVADAGSLVGLPRKELNESLDTLVRMADEIGASVTVVKEIEVPPELSILAESQLEKWNDKRSARRKDLMRMMKQDVPLITTTGSETGISHTDAEDNNSPCLTSPAQTDFSQFRSLPTPFPFDPALAVFAIDVGEEVANNVEKETQAEGVAATVICATEFPVSLEIFPVYKRITKCASHTASTSIHSGYTKKKRHLPSNTTETVDSIGGSIAQDFLEALPHPQGAAEQPHREKQPKYRALLTHVPTHPSTNSADSHSPPSYQSKLIASNFSHLVVDRSDGDAPQTTSTMPPKSRLIVEALVVRRSVLDDTLLDLEGFSLQ